ncbi:MAG: HNH endonuclease [Mycobacterium sp.]|nr:HNH endonuclease [Mycobacterium sp.]
MSETKTAETKRCSKCGDANVLAKGLCRRHYNESWRRAKGILTRVERDRKDRKERLEAMSVKRCSRCGIAKSLEHFAHDATRWDGLQPKCKECCSALNKTWHDAHPDRSVRRRALNPERARAHDCATNSARRARKRQAPQDRESIIRARIAAIWDDIRAGFGACILCGDTLPTDSTPNTVHIDHFHALAAGGAHTAANLAPAHATCNASKHDDPFSAWWARSSPTHPETRRVTIWRDDAGNEIGARHHGARAIP